MHPNSINGQFIQYFYNFALSFLFFSFLFFNIVMFVFLLLDKTKTTFFFLLYYTIIIVCKKYNITCYHTMQVFQTFPVSNKTVFSSLPWYKFHVYYISISLQTIYMCMHRSINTYTFFNLTVHVTNLCTFTTDTACQLDIFWHDGNTFCMDCTQVSIFK